MTKHNCQAVVFRCLDFRIKLSALAQLLSSIGYPEGSYDLVSVAGSGKDLLSATPSETNFLIKQIELSQKLHCISEIVILYHDNCGAYGIADADQEAKTQKSDLQIIRELLNQKFPDLKVKTCIIEGTPAGNLKIEKIDDSRLPRSW